MILIIATWFSMLFSEGTETFLLMNDLETRVKKVVQDEAQLDNVLKEVDKLNTVNENYEAIYQEQTKQFNSLMLNRATREIEFNVFFEQVQKEREAYQDKLVACRVAICKQLSGTQWQTLVGMDKNPGKLNNSVKNTEQNDFMGSTRKAINKRVKEDSRKRNLIQHIDAMDVTFSQLEIGMNQIVQIEAMITERRTSNTDELLRGIKGINNLREAAKVQIVEFHRIAKLNTTEKEWPHIMKTMTY